MNYILTNEQVQALIDKKIINPFVPKGEDGFTPIYVLNKEDLPLLGEGGLGSGKPLKNLTAEQKAERRKQQLKNAQRKYRDANREKYNENQKKIYQAMKEDSDQTRYKRWKDNMIVANTTYRLKLSQGKPSKIKIKEIVNELKEEWKKLNPVKRGRKAKGEPIVTPAERKAQEKAWIEAQKKKRIEEEKAKISVGAVIPKKPTGRFNSKDAEIYVKYPEDLKTSLLYPYAGDIGAKGGEKGDMPYTEQEYIKYNLDKKENEKKIEEGDKGKKSLVPRAVKKAYRKLAGKEIIDAEDKKEMKQKAEDKKPKKPVKQLTKEETELKLLKEWKKDVNQPKLDIKSESRRKLIISGNPFKTWYEEKYGKKYE